MEQTDEQGTVKSTAPRQIEHGASECGSSRALECNSDRERESWDRFWVVVVFSIAFAYIESAVVVYLRQINHPDGFAFPMGAFSSGPLSARLLLTEVGREASTIVVIITGCLLAGRTRRERFAYFLVIFAVWDIFYYVWLKVLLNWPASIMDWDILFLIPMVWAGPVVVPVLVSLVMLAFAIVILYRDAKFRAIKVTRLSWVGFIAAALIVVVTFCIAGLHIAESDYRSHLSWPLLAVGIIGAIALFVVQCLRKSE